LPDRNSAGGNALRRMLFGSISGVKAVSRKGAKPQRKAPGTVLFLCVFLCVFAPLREKFFSYA
jgi:hypothetical protein